MPTEPGARRGPGPGQRVRSERTRDAVIAATVGLVRDGGVAMATAQAISSRSGVSWGGIQHQFGGKNALLDAALERLVAELAVEWTGLPEASGPLEERVGHLVDLAWRIVRNPAYQPLLALLRHRAASDPGVFDEAVAGVHAQATRASRRLFADLDVDIATLDLVDSFCFAAVGGIAETRLLAPMNPAMVDDALAMVAGAILRTLGEA